MKRSVVLLVILATVLLMGGPAGADRTVTVKTLTLDDFSRIVVDHAGGALTICGSYQVKDATGAPIGNLRVTCKPLTAAQRGVFAAFVRDVAGLVTDANTAEGL